jgi:restriction endonuclease Mrr
MPDPSPDTVALWLSRELSTTDYQPLEEAIAASVVSRGVEFSLEEASEFAERVQDDVVAALLRLANESKEEGFEPLFEIDTSDPKCYIRPRKTATTEYLDRLLKLSDKQFERFCARVLKQFGSPAECSGKPGDGGVDFIARHIEICSPASVGARVLVVGQAKKYHKNHHVKLNEIRNFVGGAVHRVADHSDPSTFRTAVLAPVVFAFWTTSDFLPSAKRYARSIGLWYLNGVGIAQLAINKGITDPESS